MFMYMFSQKKIMREPTEHDYIILIAFYMIHCCS